jgi:succinylarginine dihydrolase
MQRAEARGERSPTYLITPPTATALHARLRGLGLSWSEGVLAQGKLLDAQAAAALLGDASGATVAVETETREGRAHTVVAVAGARARTTIEAEELLSLLTPARGRRQALQDLERRCEVSLATLPLPLFAWGLDSI